MSKEAFKAKKLTAFWFYPEDLVLITDPEHPLYDKRVTKPVNDGLVASILMDGQGVIEPVIVTKHNGGSDPIIVDGRQRTKAAIEANILITQNGGERIKIPAIYKRGTESALYGMTITTNEHRVDDDPIEKAEKVNAMLNFGKPKREIAVLFGVSTQTIDQWLNLLELDQDTRVAVSTGAVKPTNALKARKLPEKQKRVVMTGPRMRKKKEIIAMRDKVMSGEVAWCAGDVFKWILGGQ